MLAKLAAVAYPGSCSAASPTRTALALPGFRAERRRQRGDEPPVGRLVVLARAQHVPVGVDRRRLDGCRRIPQRV
jgi:hypothetical protein